MFTGGCFVGKFFVLYRVYINPQIHAVGDGSGNFTGVAFHLIGIAHTFFFRVPQVAAGAGVHSAYQQNICRECNTSFCARNRNHPVFQGLAQGLQNSFIKFGKLVHEENTAMRKCNFTRPRERAAAYKRNVRGSVVRTAERALGDNVVSVCG